MTQAIKDQADRIAFAHTGFFTSEPAERLADRLIAHAPEGIERVYFVSGGSEAVGSLSSTPLTFTRLKLDRIKSVSLELFRPC